MNAGGESVAQQGFQHRHPHRHAVGDLPQHARLRAIGHLIADLDADLLERLARCQPDVPADGEVLQLIVVHLAGELGLAIDVASTLVRRVFADRDSGNPPGWLLAELRERHGTEWVVQRLNASAVAARAQLDHARIAATGRHREAS